MNRNYYHPIVFEYPTIVSNEPTFDEVPMPKKSEDNEDSGFHLDYFLSDDAEIKGNPEVVELELEKKRKRSSKAKPISASELPVPLGSQAQIQSKADVAYAETYAETNAVLQTAIAQSDQLLGEVKQDIDNIRASKTLKGKYTYITNLTASAASLINTRITAAREINNSITQAHNLELKRTKDIKDMARDDKNDDARMMDMYNAFVNNPMGMYDNQLNMPTIPNMMLGVNNPGSNVTGVSMNAEHQTTMTPEQLRMRLENNPNIEEIVKYDSASGRRWFEVVDKSTGQSIPNYPTSDQFLLEDASVDVRAGIVKNRNLDKVWPLQTVGELSEY